jgi:hypothetical protein
MGFLVRSFRKCIGGTSTSRARVAASLRQAVNSQFGLPIISTIFEITSYGYCLGRPLRPAEVVRRRRRRFTTATR